MKPLPLFLTVLATITLTLQGATLKLVEVPFAFGPSTFREGDAIIIHQVLATSQAMNPGDRVIVRGRYRLRTEPGANLGVSLTQTQSREKVRGSPEANQRVTRGTGDFEVAIDVPNIGCLHLTFSTLASPRQSFGTIYFGTPAQVERVRSMGLPSFRN